jgi:hypothetical protein
VASIRDEAPRAVSAAGGYNYFLSISSYMRVTRRNQEEFVKKTVSIIMLCALIVSISACKKNQFKDLVYGDVTTTDWLQAGVKKKNGESVLWFQVFDQKENSGIADSYRTTEKKVDNYPAKIFDNKWIWLLVNDRIEIRLIADDKSVEFKNNDKLRDFILTFDLSGMEKVTGPALKGKDLEKFIPKLAAD